jgi:glycosyltransferase involved in cell wall biosynthesis
VLVDLAYSSKRASTDLDQLVQDIERHGGATLDLEVGNAPCPGDFKAFRGLRRMVREREPKVIHAHSSKAGILARALSLTGTDATILYTPHAYYGSNPTGNRVRAFVFNTIERAAGRFGVSINLNEAEARFAREHLRLPHGKQHVIPNGVDLRRFHSVESDERRALREKHNLPVDAILLGTTGRATEQKDPVTLYRGLLAAMEKDERLHFYHLGWKGDEELMREVDAMIEKSPAGDRIIRVPYTSDPAPHYQVLDAFVLASKYEGMSYAVLEALSTGLPLILTKAEGNQYLDRYRLPGLYWAEVEAPETLTDAIDQWRRSGQSTPLAEHSRVARTHFSRRASCRRLALSYAQTMLHRRLHSMRTLLQSLQRPRIDPRLVRRSA